MHASSSVSGHGAPRARLHILFTPHYAMQAKTAPTKLEDYYNPDLSVVLVPQTLSSHRPGLVGGHFDFAGK